MEQGRGQARGIETLNPGFLVNTVAILQSAFVLSFVALLVFTWSQRTGLFDRRSKGAEVIFAPGEIGRIETDYRQDRDVRHHVDAIRWHRNLPRPADHRDPGPPGAKHERSMSLVHLGQVTQGAARMDLFQSGTKIRPAAKRPTDADGSTTDITQRLGRAASHRSGVMASFLGGQRQSRGNDALAFRLAAPQSVHPAMHVGLHQICLRSIWPGRGVNARQEGPDPTLALSKICSMLVRRSL